jgi:hypothetical protein
MLITEDGGAVFRGGEQGLSGARDQAGNEASLSGTSFLYCNANLAVLTVLQILLKTPHG